MMKIKKNILKICLLLTSFVSYGQIAIGKANVDGDGLLDFSNNDNRGMVLPWVTSASSVLNPVGGTLIFDVSDKKCKYFNGTLWLNLGNSGSVDTVFQDNLADVGNGIILGDETSSAEGVLVLESSNKALILPKSDNVVLKVTSPAAGTIVYDTTTNSVCIFDGLYWSFWGENDDDD